MRISVSVDDKNVKKRLRRIEHAAEKSKKVTTPQVARWVRDQIILRMPKDTGRTASSIGIKKETYTKDTAEVGVGITKPASSYGSRNDPASWKGTSENLVDFMMNSPMAVTGFYPYGNKNAGLVTFSKDVKMMRNVPFEAKDKFGKLIRRNFKTR